MINLEINKQTLKNDVVEKGYFEIHRAITELVDYGIGIGTLYQLEKLFKQYWGSKGGSWILFDWYTKLSEGCNVCGKYDPNSLMIFRVKLASRDMIQCKVTSTSLVHFDTCDIWRRLRGLL